MDPSCRYIYPSVTLDYNNAFVSEWKKYIKQEGLAAGGYGRRRRRGFGCRHDR